MCSQPDASSIPTLTSEAKVHPGMTPFTPIRYPHRSLSITTSYPSTISLPCELNSKKPILNSRTPPYACLMFPVNLDGAIKYSGSAPFQYSRTALVVCCTATKSDEHRHPSSLKEKLDSTRGATAAEQANTPKQQAKK